MPRARNYPNILERMVDEDLARIHFYNPEQRRHDQYVYGMGAVATRMGLHHPGESFEQVDGDTHEVLLEESSGRMRLRNFTETPSSLDDLPQGAALALVDRWIGSGIINPIADFYTGAYWDKENWDRTRLYVQ